PPIKAQRNLNETLQLQNKFLACACVPTRDMEIAFNHESSSTPVVAEVIELNQLNRFITELVLQCETPIAYHGGQSLLVLNNQRIGKKLSIASASSAGSCGRIEIHVEHIDGNTVFAPIQTSFDIGNKLFVYEASGDMHYRTGRQEQALLLSGWNGGLGALLGIVQDAFENHHSGPVYLFHSVSGSEHLYFQTELQEIGACFPNFHYIPCAQPDSASKQAYQGNVETIIANTLPDLSGWKVFTCGNLVRTYNIQRHAYLAGAAMKDIYLEVTSL
ncbi:MAG: hypothetical protein ACXW0Q_06105, partial [Methylovulum sp.]